MDTNKKNYLSVRGGSASGGKFYLMLVLCLLVRLIPFRTPNIEPILAATMPFSRVYGAFTAFSFAVLSILLYDLATSTLGMQTFFTAGPIEVRAWTVKIGATAPQAAGVIHTDFEKGFIKAILKSEKRMRGTMCALPLLELWFLTR